MNQGAGLRILTETVTSPTLALSSRSCSASFPRPSGISGSRWRATTRARRLAAGVRRSDRRRQYRFDRADVILSLDADFLFFGPASLRYARDFADKRRVHGPQAAMNRLYVVESTPTVTGSMADHRLAAEAERDRRMRHALAARTRAFNVTGAAPSSSLADKQKWLGAVDPRSATASRPQPGRWPATNSRRSCTRLAHAMNQALGNVGATVVYTEPVEAQPTNQPNRCASWRAIWTANAVQLLIILGGNPVYSAPADLNFARRSSKSNFTSTCRRTMTRLRALCHWHVPEAHYLESWSDVRAYDGTATIIQPLIAPLYGGRTAHELAVRFARPTVADELRNRARLLERRSGQQDFERLWRKCFA